MVSTVSHDDAPKRTPGLGSRDKQEGQRTRQLTDTNESSHT